MDKNEFKKLVREGLEESLQEFFDQNNVMDNPEDMQSNSLKRLQRSIENDKDMFDQPQDWSDLDKYRVQRDDYAGEEFNDDSPITPGYIDEDNIGIDDIETIGMSDIDMPIQDKGVFSAMDSEEIEDDMSDVSSYNTGVDDYENEYLDEEDNGLEDGSVDYSDDIENWDSLDTDSQEELMNIMTKDFEGSLDEEDEGYGEVETTKVTIKELNEIIKEGVQKLHKQTLVENRIEEINQELNALNNPQAWDNAKSNATEQLQKKNIAHQETTRREQLMSETETPAMLNKKESVAEIMAEAAKLMAEAKARYENISK